MLRLLALGTHAPKFTSAAIIPEVVRIGTRLRMLSSFHALFICKSSLILLNNLKSTLKSQTRKYK